MSAYDIIFERIEGLLIFVFFSFNTLKRYMSLYISLKNMWKTKMV